MSLAEPSPKALSLTIYSAGVRQGTARDVGHVGLTMKTDAARISSRERERKCFQRRGSMIEVCLPWRIFAGRNLVEELYSWGRVISLPYRQEIHHPGKGDCRDCNSLALASTHCYDWGTR